MNKTIKVKTIVTGLFIAMAVFVIVDIIPFIFLWAGLSARGTFEQITLQKWAVKTSVFKFQKIYTRNSVLPLLVLTGDYVDAIHYFRELELLDGADNLNTRLAIYSYIQTGDYRSALQYAHLIDDKSRAAQIYIKLKDFKKAAILVESLLRENPVKISTYLYKSELLFNEGRYGDAETYVNKALGISPTYVDALYLKSRILNKTGRGAEAKRCFNQAKYLESKRKSIYD